MSADRWFGLPPTLRIGVITAVWFGYAVLVLDLNALDSGSRSAKFILRTGELPATHDRDEWRRRLGRSTMWHAIAPCVWGPPLWFGVFSSLSSQSMYGQVTVWPFVLLSVVGGVAYWR